MRKDGKICKSVESFKGYLSSGNSNDDIKELFAF